MILLDTHTLVWYLQDDKKLGRRANAAIDGAAEAQKLFVSPVSFWEIGLLVERGKIALGARVDAFRVRALSLGIEEESLDGYMCIAAAQLPSKHGDPADRFLVATAMLQGYTLVTADRVLLAWKLRGLKTQEATA